MVGAYHIVDFPLIRQVQPVGGSANSFCDLERSSELLGPLEAVDGMA